MARISEPSSVYKKYLAETEDYSDRYANILGKYTSQVASSQLEYANTASELSAEASANISQAYSNYLAKQRNMMEIPELSSGDFSRLSERDLSAYSSAYQAYKASEQSGIANAYNKMLSQNEQYASTFESKLESLNKDLTKEVDKVRGVESYLTDFAKSLGYDTEASDLTEAYVKSIAGYSTGENGEYISSGKNLYTYLSEIDEQELADYYYEHKNELDKFFLSGVDISGYDLSKSEQAKSLFKEIENRTEYLNLKPEADLLGIKIDDKNKNYTQLKDEYEKAINNKKEELRQDKIRNLEKNNGIEIISKNSKLKPNINQGSVKDVDASILDAVGQGVFDNGDIISINGKQYLVYNNLLYNKNKTDENPKAKTFFDFIDAFT